MAPKAHIIILDTDPSTRDVLARQLDGETLGLDVVANPSEVLLRVEAGNAPDLVIAELHHPDMHGLEFLRRLSGLRSGLPVIMTTAFASVGDVVAAMQAGAADVLSKPFGAEEAAVSVERALEKGRLLRENTDLREALDDRLDLANFIATDPAMHGVLKTVRAVAAARTTVLVTGESGTGKTLLARAIHNLSPRREGPFIEVNCGALPENLLESELFGHVKGAFTGAVKDRPGKFEAADCGTIFLDEIGTSTPAFQVKLLRVLQDRIIERVGDTQTRSVDVRIILATNLDLAQAVQEGNFREDLFYRIQVVTLEMPTLRQRRADIPFLAEHFLARHREDSAKTVRGFSSAAMDILVRAPWPGNVRQLENVVERAVVLTEHNEIQPEDLPPGLLDLQPQDIPSGNDLLTGSHLLPLKDALLMPEKVLIERALDHYEGNRTQTARSLDINRSTLFNKMKKFGLL